MMTIIVTPEEFKRIKKDAPELFKYFLFEVNNYIADPKGWVVKDER